MRQHFLARARAAGKGSACNVTDNPPIPVLSASESDDEPAD
jgi:hypothetical protein